MMVHNEKLIIKEIFESGYQHAAKSFSLLTGLKINSGVLTVELRDATNLHSHEMPVETSFTLLCTKLLGDTKGESILILNELERKLISDQNLVIAGTTTSISKKSFLMELDNIVSASAITEVSDALDINIYGVVPSLLEINNATNLHNYLSRDQLTIFIKGYFNIEGYEELKPAFIFRMHEDILEFAKHTS